MSTKKIILDLCGGTGAWGKPYVEKGYDVRNISLPNYDVRTFHPPKNVHGILAAPPCTMFSLAGNRWRFEEKKALTYISKLIEALSIVNGCLRIIKLSKPNFWCLENPVGTLTHFLGKPMIIFNPCDFGDNYTKKTALWGHFNLPLPLFIGEDRSVKPEFVTYKGGKRFAKNYGWSTNKNRSVTPAGFAKAFFEVNP